MKYWRSLLLLVLIGTAYWFYASHRFDSSSDIAKSVTEQPISPVKRDMDNANITTEPLAPETHTPLSAIVPSEQGAEVDRSCAILRALQNSSGDQSALTIYKELSHLFKLTGDENPEQLANFVERQLRYDQYASLYIEEQEFVDRHPYHDYDNAVLESLSQQGDGMASLIRARNLLHPVRHELKEKMKTEQFLQAKELLYRSLRQGQRESLTMLLELLLMPTKYLPIAADQLNDKGYSESQLIELQALRQIIEEHGTLQSFLRAREQSEDLQPESEQALSMAEQKYRELKRQLRLPPLSDLDLRARKHFSLILEAVKSSATSSRCSTP